MPLRDHFRPPLDDQRHWECFHATWTGMIVSSLRDKLPAGYSAEPRTRIGKILQRGKQGYRMSKTTYPPRPRVRFAEFR